MIYDSINVRYPRRNSENDSQYIHDYKFTNAMGHHSYHVWLTTADCLCKFNMVNLVPISCRLVLRISRFDLNVSYYEPLESYITSQCLSSFRNSLSYPPVIIIVHLLTPYIVLHQYEQFGCHNHQGTYQQYYASTAQATLQQTVL